MAHRDDKSKFLLYIDPEPSDKLETPIDDEMTKVVEYALSRAQTGSANYSDKNGPERFRPGSGYKGCHGTRCGQRSSSHDYLLENGMITNSLAPYYVKWYRYSIPENDMIKLNGLMEFYKGKDLTITPKEKIDKSPFQFAIRNNRRFK